MKQRSMCTPRAIELGEPKVWYYWHNPSSLVKAGLGVTGTAQSINIGYRYSHPQKLRVLITWSAYDINA